MFMVRSQKSVLQAPCQQEKVKLNTVIPLMLKRFQTLYRLVKANLDGLGYTGPKSLGL